MSFDKLGLSDELLRAVESKGYTTPSPIQAKAIPAILTGRDVLAAAQTGTGKTAGFSLPLLQMLADPSAKRDGKKGKRPVRALIMTPTRELAAQVLESIETYGKNLSLNSTVVFGGVPIKPQINKLQNGVDILVATPGRLLDLYNQGVVAFKQVETFVLDEADRMLDMGFIHDIRKIIALLPKKRQNLLFSATFSGEIRNLTKQLLHDPISVEVAARNTAAETVEQQVYYIEKADKPLLLKHLIHEGAWEQVLVFTRTKHGADRLCKKLGRHGIKGAAIHGNKSQNARTRVLADFKAGRVRVLVATDIAARGLDIKQLPHVVNYELPNVSEDYVHRIGRTGRAGATGHAVSLVDGDERKLLKNIEKLLNKRLPTGKVGDYNQQSGAEKKAVAALQQQEQKQRQQDQQSFGNERGEKPVGQKKRNRPNRRRNQGRNDSQKPSGQNRRGGSKPRGRNA